MDIKHRIPILLLVLYIILGGIIQYNGISEFKSLPSPIYGGDYYYQMGVIWHIREGGNPLESSSMVGGMPGYLPLYAYICAKFCDLFNLDTMKGMFYFSIVLFVVASVIWFCLFRVLFKDDWIALIGVVLANGISAYPILKYTNFTHQIMLPLFILTLYLAFKERKIIYYVSLGLVYGLLTLSHMVAFVGATLIIATFVIYEMYKNKDRILEYLKENIKNWGIFGIVALPILMLYWYKPIFVYHLHRPYDRIHMDIMDFGRLDVQIKFLFNTLSSYLLNFKSIGGIITTVLVWLGIYGYYKSENSDLKEFLKIFAIGSVFATFCYFVTEPLFGINFIPTYMSYFYIWATAILFALFGINYVKNHLRLHEVENISKKLVVFGTIFVILLANTTFAFVNYINNDRWANVGKHPMPDVYISLQNYLLKNTDVNDVILSTKELSFVINAISGRKVMVNRWAQQNDPYMNLPQRDMDASIILYGNDTKKKLELIRKYNISYLYWDYYWINSEFQFDNNGRIIGMYDPLMTYDTKENREYLDKYGVKYIPMNFWIDPSCRNDNIRKFNILVISPQNYYNFTNPWKPDLNKYLVEVWNYTYNGQKIAALYKIKVD
ncbi:hypothetical protein JH146_0050 [Methanocaldococcus bathoardescens]|uniref:Glycosyltransferase RgtA/B/C/D-like domain-containing protein n=1 Tax=Methanocaldococcus bathoardescens TaxID=1301915 RepID=A0A076L9L3_9EURY|nr:glycosyltransferase family 39 protein [Methanocaldococcus bathoardescens]AIJ04901.1 hypothetical protein JH146_0050 [Methanocaldococcus bathoardescens]